MKGNEGMIKNMVWVECNYKMGRNIKGNGNLDKKKEGESIFLEMEMYMKVGGEKEKGREWEDIYGLMGLNIMDYGKLEK